MNYLIVESQKSKVKRRKTMKIILLILSLLLVVPVSAAPQNKQTAGNPSLNVNATQTQKKQQATFQPQQIQQQKKQSAATRSRRQPVRYIDNERSSQLSVPMQTTSALRDGHSVTPSTTSATATFEPQAVGSSASAPLYQTSGQGRKGATAHWGGMSGGASAEGLMSSGSRYIDNGKSSDVTSSLGAPTSQPRKGFPGDDPDPFPDPITPIGDALLPLALLALAFAAFIALRRKKVA